MKNIILIKLGGSIITNKKIAYSARKSVIKRLAKELKVSKETIILAHGSGSFGHTSAVKFGGKQGYESKKGIAKVALDSISINKIVMDILIQEGIPAISLRPMSMIVSNAGKTQSAFFEPIEQVVKQELMPVVFGDVIWDKKWKSTIYSGEVILNKLAIYLRKKGFNVKRIIQVGETNGVYDDNKNTIPIITNKTWPEFKKFIFVLKTKDVTGGMQHKVKDALKMTNLGIETLLINGKTKNELSKALLNKKVKGTLIK